MGTKVHNAFASVIFSSAKSRIPVLSNHYKIQSVYLTALLLFKAKVKQTLHCNFSC